MRKFSTRDRRVSSSMLTCAVLLPLRIYVLKVFLSLVYLRPVFF